MSKLYLVEHQQQFARIMNSKAEEGITEGNSKYRSVMCELIVEEILKMRKSYGDFDLANEELDVLMMRRHQSEQNSLEMSSKEVRLLATHLYRTG